MYNEKYKGHKINIEKGKIMSKMTKTIVALGVVAGLGVAALPLSSYAQIVLIALIRLRKLLSVKLSP